MSTPESISGEIVELMKSQGSLTLAEVERYLGVSYNLVFLAIDRMVENHLLILERHGRDYILSPVAS